jgi:hypothetical protein
MLRHPAYKKYIDYLENMKQSKEVESDPQIRIIDTTTIDENDDDEDDDDEDVLTIHNE